jgi:hypothetical protein
MVADYGLPRTHLLGSWVNNVRCEGGDRQPNLTATRIASANSLIIERPGARHACSDWGTLSGLCDKSRLGARRSSYVTPLLGA